MKFKTITKEQYQEITDIYNNFPNLTYQNKGYTYSDKTKWTEEDVKGHKKVEDVLRNSILGFSEFNHFVPSKEENRIRIRFQYNWDADKENGVYFIGVEYMYLDEFLEK